MENPYQPATPVAITLPAIEFAKTKIRWTIELHPEHLAFSSESEPQPLIYPRGDFEKKIQYVEGTRLIAIKFPRQINLRLEPGDVKTFWRWWRPPTLENLKMMLAKRYSYTWVLALVFLLTAVAFPSKSLLTDLLYGGIGITMLAVAIFSKFNPKPIAFLLDGAWWILLGCLLGWRIYRGGNGLWILLIMVNAMMATNAIKMYRHFAGEKSAGIPSKSVE